MLLDFCRWLQVFTSIHLFSPWVGVNFLRRLFGQDLLQKPHEQRKVLFRAYLARSAGRLPVAPFFLSFARAKTFSDLRETVYKSNGAAKRT